MKCSRCERSSNTVTVTCDKCQLLLCSDCLPIGANQCNECSEEAEKGPGGGAPPISELNSVLAQLLLSTEFHGIISNIVKMAIQDDRALSEAQGEKSPPPPTSNGHNGSTPIHRNSGAISKIASFGDSSQFESVGKSGDHSDKFDNSSGRNNDTLFRNNVNKPDETLVFEKSMALKKIEESIRLEPITKEQRAYRVNNTELPPFSGDGCDWWLFFVAYKESTKLCNFSALENLKRLQQALAGRAKEKVAHLLNMPHKVDKIMSILKNEFTRPQILMQNAVHLSEEVPQLQKDLSNAAAFYVAVERVRNVWDLVQGRYSDTLVLQNMEGRLSTQVARDWIHETPKDDGDVQKFFTFVEKIYEESHRLQHLKRSDLVAGQQHGLMNDCKTDDQEDWHCQMNCGNLHQHGLAECGGFKAASMATRWAVVKQQHRCFNCLQKNHLVQRCSKQQQCRVSGCWMKHHPLLHYETSAPVNEVVQVARVGAARTLFRVVPVVVSSCGRSVSTYALLDPASSVTMMDAGLAKQLGVSGVQREIPVAWTDGKNHQMKTERVGVSISSPRGGKVYKIEAQTKAGMNLPSPCCSSGRTTYSYC